jgi:hypothetical protein
MGAFASRDDVSASWAFSGHVLGAPTVFVVPEATSLRLMAAALRSAGVG